ARFEERAEIGPIPAASSDRIAAGGKTTAVATMEKQTRRDFVSYLHHVGSSARGHELRHDVLGVVVNGGCKRVDRRQSLPCHRHALLAWVGPVVAVMKVEQKAHACGFDPLAEGDGVGEIAVPILLVVSVGRLGIDERAQADVVEAVVLEELENLFGRSVAVGRSAGFVGLDPGDVRANEEARNPRTAVGARAAVDAAGVIRSAVAAAATHAAAAAGAAHARRAALAATVNTAGAAPARAAGATR